MNVYRQFDKRYVGPGGTFNAGVWYLGMSGASRSSRLYDREGRVVRSGVDLRAYGAGSTPQRAVVSTRRNYGKR